MGKGRAWTLPPLQSPPQLHVSLHRFHPASPLLPCCVMALLRRINPKDAESTPMECRRQWAPTAIPLPHSIQAMFVVVCAGGTAPQGHSPVQVAPTTRQTTVWCDSSGSVSGRRKNRQVQGPIAHSFNINSASRYCQTGRKLTPLPPPLLPSKPCPTAIHQHPTSLPMVLTASQHDSTKMWTAVTKEVADKRVRRCCAVSGGGACPGQQLLERTVRVESMT